MYLLDSTLTVWHGNLVKVTYGVSFTLIRFTHQLGLLT